MIVGFGHRAQVGKDTAGNWLQDWGWKRLAFADKVRDVLYDLDPVVDPVSQSYYFTLKHMVDSMGWEMAKQNFEVRSLLQKLGHAVRDKIDPSIWCRVVMHEADRLDEEGIDVVITDVRYKNEADAIHALGGLVCRIDRGISQRLTHAGEEELEDYEEWDHIIDNNGSIKDLQEQVTELFLKTPQIV